MKRHWLFLCIQLHDPTGSNFHLFISMLIKSLHGGLRKGSQRTEQDETASKKVGIVVIVFALCWLPINVVLMIISFGNPSGRSQILAGFQLASICLVYLDTCVNPFLYATLQYKSFCHHRV